MTTRPEVTGRRTGAPKRHHLDRRADAILAADAGADDELLSTRAVAAWLGVSEQWLEIGRHRGYGPEFVKLSARVVRYTRGNVRKFLKARTHKSTAAYAGGREVA